MRAEAAHLLTASVCPLDSFILKGELPSGRRLESKPVVGEGSRMVLLLKKGDPGSYECSLVKLLR